MIGPNPCRSIPPGKLVLCLLLLLCSVLTFGCDNAKTNQVDLTAPPPEPPWPPTASQIENENTDPHTKKLSLLDNETLEGWEISNFGGEGECHVENGELTIEMGYPLSGVTSNRADLPSDDYEISLEAKRVQGVDFFCGLTFPVEDSWCTLIIGGWGGAIVGLSCVDDRDAAANETKRLMNFEDDTWYKIRVAVGDSIEAWIDDEKIVDLETAGHKFSLRAETLVSKPLGICNFETTSRFRNISIQKHPATHDPEIQEE